jgi:hypothetical protein
MLSVAPKRTVLVRGERQKSAAVEDIDNHCYAQRRAGRSASAAFRPLLPASLWRRVGGGRQFVSNRLLPPFIGFYRLSVDGVGAIGALCVPNEPSVATGTPWNALVRLCTLRSEGRQHGGWLQASSSPLLGFGRRCSPFWARHQDGGILRRRRYGNAHFKTMFCRKWPSFIWLHRNRHHGSSAPCRDSGRPSNVFAASCTVQSAKEFTIEAPRQRAGNGRTVRLCPPLPAVARRFRGAPASAPAQKTTLQWEIGKLHSSHPSLLSQNFGDHFWRQSLVTSAATKRKGRIWDGGGAKASLTSASNEINFV